MSRPRHLSVGFEDEIVGDHDSNGEPRPDGDGWLNIERPSDELFAGLVEALGSPLTDRLDERVFVVAGPRLRSDAEQRRENRGLEHHAPVIVHFVLEPGVTFGVGARLPLQNDRLAVRHDEAVPDQERAGLAEGYLRVVLAAAPGALRDQQGFSGRAVIDVFCHLGGYWARPG